MGTNIHEGWTETEPPKPETQEKEGCSLKVITETVRLAISLLDRDKREVFIMNLHEAIEQVANEFRQEPI